MIRPAVFALIAVLSHLYFGFALVTAFLFYAGTKWALIVSGIYGVLIAIKEAFIDPITETPEEAGSGLQDFLTNMAGAGLAWLAFFLLRK